MQKLKSFLKEKGYDEQLSTVAPSNDYIRFDHNKKNTGYFNLKHLKVGEKVYITALFGDHSLDEEFRYQSDLPTDPEELAKVKQAFIKADKEQDESKRKLQEEVSDTYTKLWDTYPVGGTHPYLERKGLWAEASRTGGRINQGDLLVPCRDVDGKLWGVQRILADGTKRFTPGQRVKGVMHVIGSIDDGKPILVGEGYATAGSLHMSTQLPAVCAFNAGNIQCVCEALRSRYPNSQLIICADNDQFTTLPNGQKYNAGLEAGKRALKVHNTILRLPRFTNPVYLDRHLTDYNDLHVLEGLAVVAEQILSDPEPAQKESAKEAKRKLEAEETRKFFEATLREFDKTYHYKVIGKAKICYVWNGTHYEEMGDQYVRRYAQENLKPRPEKKKREEFLDRVLISNLVEPDWFDLSIARQMNFRNGVLNIDTGVLSAHSPTMGFRYVLPFDYVPGAGCPVYDAMMKRVTCGDVSLESLLDEYMGYALSFDRIWAHKILVLTGDGENGKSTWLDVLRSLAGEGNYTAKLMKDLENEGHRQGLDGKLFNISAEVPKRGMFDTTVIKALSSGDPVDVRQIYKRSYTMSSRAKLLFACNELPDSTDTTQGFFRRFILIPFNATFSPGSEGFDPMIKEKLQQELSGIFNRALAGYKRMLAKREFSFSQASHSVLAQYRQDCDSGATWIAENLIVGAMTEPPTHYSVIAEVYADYAEYMKMGNMRPLTSVDFGRKMGRAIAEYKARLLHKRIEGKFTRILANVTFKNVKEY